MFIANKKQRRQLKAYLRHCKEVDAILEARIDEIRNELLMHSLGFKNEVKRREAISV